MTQVDVKSTTPGNMTVTYVANCGQLASTASAGVTIAVTQPAAESPSPSSPGNGGARAATGTGTAQRAALSPPLRHARRPRPPRVAASVASGCHEALTIIPRA